MRYKDVRIKNRGEPWIANAAIYEHLQMVLHQKIILLDCDLIRIVKQ